MPEGHTVHRTANEFNKKFADTRLVITSPQGRFSDSARLVSDRNLTRAKAIGKQLFLRFDNDLILRIHLGIYGKWTWSNVNPDAVPDPVGQVRARFFNGEVLADLRGPTVCEVISAAEAQIVERRLGPDPLNPDPDLAELARFVERVRASRTSIGQLLMNQEVIAGIGNVYRAELLFRAGISPFTPGNSLPTELVENMWRDSVDLMKVGVKTGFMITRDELLTKKPKKADRNFVYKREGLPCRVCGTNISIEIMATRKLYFCSKCQD